MKAYSNDLRRKVVSAYERGYRSQREIAELFGVSSATVRNFVRRKRERGSPDQLPRAGGAPARIDDLARAELRQLVASSPDATLEEARQHLARAVGVRVGLSAVCRALAKLGLPRKKSRSTQVSATRHES
ncbi:MAG: transposase [Acidobacteria bacterium]|nr:transposase [Acidobacteriota bacterium]